MKKELYLLICLLIISSSIFAQEQEFPCTNEVNTNPDNPSNSSLPVDDNGNPDFRFLNGFDWVNGDVGNGSYSTNGMFFTQNQPYGNMLNIKPQTIPNTEFYHYLWTGPKFSPDNGWELLADNRGWYPSNDIETPMSKAKEKFFH